MSWSIPTQVEQDIIAGKAVYKTFQTGNGGQSILPVPANAYAVIFGYDFSPAGGGFKLQSVEGYGGGSFVIDLDPIKTLETQQISFYTGTDFYPFIHHINSQVQSIPQLVNAGASDAETLVQILTEYTIDNSPIARQVYITSNNDISITHGCVRNSFRVSANAIPTTNRTPQGLTYGGSPQVINTQTNYGPAGTPLQFMQPSPKDYQDFAFGLLPSNADGQAFATPDAANGLIDPTDLLTPYGANILRDTAAYNYYLCIHYALYNKSIPETRG